MRRFSLFLMVVAMTAAAAGCGGDGDDGDDGDDVTATTAAATTVPAQTTAPGPTIAATNLTLRVTDVRLVNSEESDSGMRILLPAGVATASVTLTGLPSPNRVINVCQANDLDRRLGGAACRTPANGEAVTVTLGSSASGVEIIQVGTTGTGIAGNSAAVEEILVRYTANSRQLNVRLPQIAADSGGRPTFALTPASTDGAYRATLTWTVIPVFGGSPSSGVLELLQGGNPTSRAEGGSADVRLNGNVPPPVGDVAIRVRNDGMSALVTPKLSLLLP